MAADKQEFLDTLFGNRKSDYEVSVCLINLCVCMSFLLFDTIKIIQCSIDILDFF